MSTETTAASGQLDRLVRLLERIADTLDVIAANTGKPIPVIKEKRRAIHPHALSWAKRIIAGESVKSIADSCGCNPGVIRQGVLRLFRGRNENLYVSMIATDFGTTREPSMRSLIQRSAEFGFEVL